MNYMNLHELKKAGGTGLDAGVRRSIGMLRYGGGGDYARSIASMTDLANRYFPWPTREGESFPDFTHE
jgi:hypothetical protein